MNNCFGKKENKVEIKKNKNMLNRLGKEIVFDAFSTICTRKSNKISTVIDTYCKDKKDENDYADAIFRKGLTLENCLKLLNSFIIENKIEIESKYFYLYLVFIIYRTHDRLNKIPFTLKFIEDINRENWFKDKFRQVNFFNSRIEDFDDFYASGEFLFYYFNDSNQRVVYSFKTKEDVIDGLSITIIDDNDED